jgi:starvation-inducible outer membrane lipoprotein
MKIFMMFFCALLLAACAMPTTTVRSVDTRPSISVSKVNEQADLYVDGIRMGKAADFEEPNQLKLEAGTHRVSIVEAGKTTFEQTIFIESEHKTIIAR